jgi:hypothetical protein
MVGCDTLVLVHGGSENSRSIGVVIIPVWN